MLNRYCFSLLLTLGSLGVFAQGPVCGAASEFCAENGLSFPASTNVPDPPAGNDYGCLATAPNPAWYYMSTTGPGTASIQLQSAPAVDIDFALWGPFTSLSDALGNCGSLSSPVDCSYSSSAFETVTINSSGPGEFYILLITNYSNQPTDIMGSTSSQILGCNVCIAEGGTLSPQNQVGCPGNLDDIEVDFGAFNPDPATYGYTLVVTDAGGNITQEFPFQTSIGPALLGPGTFTICGIGYEIGTGEPGSFLGQNFNTLSTDLAGGTPPFCGDPSDNCVDITIVPDPIPTFVQDSVCLGASAPNCPQINGQYICDPGGGNFTVQNQYGCDSLITYLITPRSSVIATDSLQLCPGEEFEYDGNTYVAPQIVTIQQPAGPGGGCDTTLFLLLQSDPLLAIVTPPAFNLDCQTPSIVLESTGSSTGPNITYLWTSNGNVLGTGASITVSEAGVYTLEVIRTDPTTGVSCSAMIDAIITESPGESGSPTISGPTNVCVGQQANFFSTFTGIYGPYTFDFTFGGPAAPQPVPNGTAEVVWSAPGTYQVCVTATGSCGPTDEACTTIVVEDAVTAVAQAPPTVCGLSTLLLGQPTGGTWTSLGGPSGTGTISDPGNASTTVTVPAAGSYTFEYAVPGSCNTPAQVIVTFGDDITVGPASAVCDPGTLDYTVTFNFTGGTAPFIVTGTPGALTGQSYTTNPIASGDPYDVIIVDALGCLIQVSGTENCSCTTDAGAMPGQPVQVCAPLDLQSGSVSGQVNDGDDVGTYVLHTNPGAGLGTVLQTSPTGLFTFAAPIVANTSYYVSYVIGNDDGSGQPDPNDPCYDVSQGQEVQWIEAPAAFAGNDDGTCNASYTLAATGTPGTWSVPGGVTISDVNDPQAVVSVTTTGSYTLTWTTGLAGCTDSDEVVIDFAPAPTAIAGYDCAAGATFYDLTITATGGAGPYTVNAGFVTTGTSPTFQTTLPVGVPYSFSIVDANGCESIVYTDDPDCDCTSRSGSMASPLLEACLTESIQAAPVSGEVLDGDDVGVYILHDLPGNALGTVFQSNQTGSFTFGAPLLAGTTYYVSFVVGNDDGSGMPDSSDPCYQVAAGQPIRWFAPEQADAGLDDATCGTSLQLAAGNTQGMWTAPPGVTLSDASSPTATASVTTPGQHTLNWTTGTGSCTSTDEVVIAFYSAPTAAASFSCTPGASLYDLSISVSGGTAPYTINAAFVTSGTSPDFAAILPVGVGYSFSVVDANGCESIVYTGSPNCDCTTDAPQLTAGAQACVGDPITLVTPTGGTDDGDDTDRYVLYEGDPNAIVRVLSQNTSPAFPYDPAYVAGQVYYVAVERANDDGAGGIDDSDPCLDRSQGVPVQWNALPSITLADATTCDGDDASIDYVYTGALPASLEVLSGGITLTFALTSSTGTVTIPGVAGTVSVVNISEDVGCSNDASTATATITVQSPVDPQLIPDFSLCNSAASGDATTALTSTLVVSGGAGTWTSPDAPAALSGGEFSALGLAPGDYRLVFTTTPVGTCPAGSASLTVSVRDCACPNLTLLSPGVLCNDNAFIDLDALLQEPQVGTWAIVSSPTGGQPATLSGATFDGTGADAGQYRVLFTLTQGNVAGCPDTNSVAISLAGQVFAGTSTGDLQFCESETDVVDLSAQLVGQDAGGSWSALGGGGAALTNALVDISQLSVGTYQFEYSIAAPAPCAPATARVFIDIVASPTADAGLDQQLTCTNREVALGGSTPPGLQYTWTANGDPTVLSEEASYVASLTGIYTLSVTDPLTGCSRSDDVEVTATDEVPVVSVALQPISCAGERDGAITISGIEGGAGPYRVELNGNPVSERNFYELGPGNFSLQVTDANGCSADALSFELTDPEPLAVSLVTNLGGTGQGSGTIAFRDTVLLEAVMNSDSASVLWSPSEFVACDTCPVTYGLPPSTLTYAVSVVDAQGCTDEATVQVIVRRERPLFFPTGFSPNGDGNNDWFYPQAPEGMVRSVRSLIVHDRWGELVYQRYGFDANIEELGWNGELNGEPLNPQVLVFVAEVEFTDGVIELFEGDISLIR